jgi:head-tail adaptor
MRGIFTPGHAIYRRTRVSDGQGGHTETYAELATGSPVMGRLHPRSGREQILGARPDEATQWGFACPPGTDVQKGDQIRKDGRIVEIDAVLPSATGRRIECVGHEYKAGG